jgi:hypothetical protein
MNTIEEHISPEWFSFPFPEVENPCAYVCKRAHASLLTKSYFSYHRQDTFEIQSKVETSHLVHHFSSPLSALL